MVSKALKDLTQLKQKKKNLHPRGSDPARRYDPLFRSIIFGRGDLPVGNLAEGPRYRVYQNVRANPSDNPVCNAVLNGRAVGR